MFMTGPPFRRNRSRRGRGQALLEFLILLPVLLLLFLATAEIAKLFAISGKTRVASRYLALRHFRNAPFELAGRDFAGPVPGAVDQVRRIFFEGVLGDPDEEDEDIGYEEFQAGRAGIFHYQPPLMNIAFWDIAAALQLDDHLFGIRGHRVTFTYDLPFFPYKNLGATRQWGQDSDPLGPYDLYTAKGDFVLLTDSFSGDTDNFLRLLEIDGLIRTIPAGLVTAGIAILVFFLFTG